MMEFKVSKVILRNYKLLPQKSFGGNSVPDMSRCGCSNCRCRAVVSAKVPLHCRCFVALTLATSFYFLRHTVRNWPSQKAYSHSYNQTAWFYESLKYVQRGQKTFRTGGSWGSTEFAFYQGCKLRKKFLVFSPKLHGVKAYHGFMIIQIQLKLHLSRNS